MAEGSSPSARALGFVACAALLFALIGGVRGMLSWWQIALAVLVAVVCAIAALVASARSLMVLREPAAAAARAYLDAIVAGSLARAYGMIADPTRASLSEDEFAARVGGELRIERYELGEVTMVSRNGGPPRAEIHSLCRYASGTVAPLLVVAELGTDGTWRIVSSNAGPGI